MDNEVIKLEPFRTLGGWVADRWSRETETAKPETLEVRRRSHDPFHQTLFHVDLDKLALDDAHSSVAR